MSFGESRSVNYSFGHDEKLNDDGAVLTIGATDEVAARQKLKDWLKLQARKNLVPELRKISHEIGMDYKKASIRNQKTRWGSCSSKGMISLNYKIILLPYKLARYLCIHELCHTKQMNHSKRFWTLVEKFDPEYRQHEKGLRESWRYLPHWLDME